MGKNECSPTPAGPVIQSLWRLKSRRPRRGIIIAGREGAVRVVIAMKRQADLLKGILRAGKVGGVALLLNVGQQHANEKRDHSDYDEQVDPIECSFGGRGR